MNLDKYNIIAIDPGSQGGIAERIGDAVTCRPFPKSMTDFRDYVKTTLSLMYNDEVVFVVEDVPKFVAGERTSVSSMATLHENFGYIKGVIDANHCTLMLIKPQAWQKIVGAGNKKAYGTRWKAHLKDLAARRFPTISDRVTLKTADALLILASVLDYTNPKKGNQK